MIYKILGDTVLVDVKEDDDSDTIEISISTGIISRGDDTIDGRGLYPGLVWDYCPPDQGRWNYAGGTIAYLINEGQILEDTIEAYSDRDGDHPAVSWKVQPTSIETLRKHGIITWPSNRKPASAPWIGQSDIPSAK